MIYDTNEERDKHEQYENEEMETGQEHKRVVGRRIRRKNGRTIGAVGREEKHAETETK